MNKIPVYLIAFFLHLPGLRVFGVKFAEPRLLKLNMIAITATLIIVSGIFMLSPIEKKVINTMVAWALTHCLWGSYLVTQILRGKITS